MNQAKIIFALVTLIFGFAPTAVCQTVAEKKMPAEINAAYSKLSFEEIVLRLSRDFGIPLGIEIDPNGESGEKLTVDYKSTPLSAALDELVKLDKRCRWEITDGVLMLTPSGHRDSLISSFLETSVERFEPGKGRSTSDMRSYIATLPNVSQLLESNDTVLFALDPPGIRYLKEINELRLKDVKVRDALNSIVENSENSNSWSLQRYGKKLILLTF